MFTLARKASGAVVCALLVVCGVALLGFTSANPLDRQGRGKVKDAEEAGGHGHDHFAWTKGYSLIVTKNTTMEQANDTVDFIWEQGGQVAIVVSPRMMLGWVSRDLVGQHGIVAVYRRPVTPEQFQPADVDEAATLEFYNKVASGQWKEEKAALGEPGDVTGVPDALTRTLSGFKTGEGGPAGSPDEPVPSPGNSDLMAGRVNMNHIFIESNGAIDPNTYTWTCADMTTIVGEISAGQSFWSSRALNYGVPLTFLTTYYRPAVAGVCGGTANVLTSYEPITRSAAPGTCCGDALWINQIMCNFGHCAGDQFARTTSFTTARRIATNANWASLSFIGYNPSPAATTFTDGWFAYAWRQGYYSHLLYRNNGWLVSQYDLVGSHETGHLFGTFDEYASSGCGNCFAGDSLSKNVVNGNCVNCNGSSVPCRMRNNETALCGYTPGQVGWGVDYKFARTSRTTALIEKTNWVPGQAIRYWIQVAVPGAPGECVTVNSRWYRQYQNNLTEAEAFSQPCLITSGGTWNIWLDRGVPAGAVFGEAALEVQLELVYASGWAYGKGVRSNLRGKFFVMNTAARMATVSPQLSLGDPQATAVVSGSGTGEE